jgi:hypothetical protein
MDASCAVEISAALTAVLLIQAIERGWPVPSEATVTKATNKLNDTVGIPTRTAASTVGALLYELRSGLFCLENEGALDRLRRCDEAAMRTIALELLSWRRKNKPWLPPWSEDDVAKLLAVKGGLK